MNLSSERLNYIKLVAADAQDYVKMAMNKEVMRYITGKALSVKDAKERFESMINSNDKVPDIGFYKVYKKKENTFIGLGKLVFIQGVTAEIGYSLLPQFWGKKYASEIAGCFIDHAQKLSYIKELIAVVNPDNIASKKLLFNYGFTWLETGFLNEQVTEIYKLNLQKNS